MKQKLAAITQHAHNTHIFSDEAARWMPILVALALTLGLVSVRVANMLSVQKTTLIPERQATTAPTPKPQEQAPQAAIAVEPTESEKLQNLLNKFAEKQPADFYIYAKNLKSGATATIDPIESVPSGSIYKMFLANQVYKLTEAGQLNLSNVVSGSNYTFGQCTYQMVQNSLNFCGEVVRNHLGAAKQTAALNKQGYTCTSLMRDDAAHTCAKDVALLLERLYNGGYFSKAHNAQFMDYLKNQLWRFRIPTGIPGHLLASGAAVTYSKTGDVYSFANDAAIVKGENTDFILVVLSGGWQKVFPDSSYAIRNLAGNVYNFMNKTNHTLPY